MPLNHTAIVQQFIGVADTERTFVNRGILKKYAACIPADGVDLTYSVILLLDKIIWTAWQNSLFFTIR